jgi:hypothetical protein
MSPDQSSERWTWAMRNSSIRPLKGSAISGYVPADAKGSRVEIDGQRIAHLCDSHTVEVETLLFGPASLS